MSREIIIGIIAIGLIIITVIIDKYTRL